MSVAGFVDVETTGLQPGYDEIVEFAIVLFAFDPETGEIAGVVDEYAGLRDPGRPIPPEATAVHGIRDRDVRGKRLDLRRVTAMVERAEFLVAHNASFDRAFVERLLPQAGSKQWYCSMNGVPWKRLGFASKGLQRLLADHGIRVERAHRGLDDVIGALTLLASADPGGQRYFKYIADRHRAALEARKAPAAGAAAGEVAAAADRAGRSGREREPAGEAGRSQVPAHPERDRRTGRSERAERAERATGADTARDRRKPGARTLRDIIRELLSPRRED